MPKGRAPCRLSLDSDAKTLSVSLNGRSRRSPPFCRCIDSVRVGAASASMPIAMSVLAAVAGAMGPAGSRDKVSRWLPTPSHRLR